MCFYIDLQGDLNFIFTRQFFSQIIYLIQYVKGRPARLMQLGHQSVSRKLWAETASPGCWWSLSSWLVGSLQELDVVHQSDFDLLDSYKDFFPWAFSCT